MMVFIQTSQRHHLLLAENLCWAYHNQSCLISFLAEVEEIASPQGWDTILGDISSIYSICIDEKVQLLGKWMAN